MCWCRRTSPALLRGGMLPQAYVYPQRMRATRDLMHRRNYLMRRRARDSGAHDQHQQPVQPSMAFNAVPGSGRRNDCCVRDRVADFDLAPASALLHSVVAGSLVTPTGNPPLPCDSRLLITPIAIRLYHVHRKHVPLGGHKIKSFFAPHAKHCDEQCDQNHQRYH